MLSPVKPAVLIRFLEAHGFKRVHTRGSHLTMRKAGISRPFTIPLHQTVSVGVILANLKTASLTRAQLLKYLKPYFVR